MREIYIFGHKKPDTDAVTSAIALANLKNQIGILSKPMILDHISKETEFVLSNFNIEIPEYLENVKLQIKDLNYNKGCYVNEFVSIRKMYNYMMEKNITGVPIVDNDKKLKGLVTSRMIGAELLNGDFTKLEGTYNNIIEVLDGEQVLKFDDEIVGNIIAAAFRSETFLKSLELKNDTIMIVGDRHSIIEAGIKNKVKLIIIVGNLDIKEEHIEMAKKNKVNIIRTHYDTFHTSRLIGFANYAKKLLTNTRTTSFNENDYYTDFKEKCAKLGYNNHPVVDENGECLGLIRVTDIKDMDRKQVILVDHNEAGQSVEGLDEADIIEIVDHHKIGSLNTNMPIDFRNMTVGSTNTIIYSLYNENDIEIPKNIAGIMLSGILSDTLKFTSPTTTDYDKYVAKRLATIAEVDIDNYASEMFKAGTDLAGKSLEEIIEGDMKVFDMNNKKIAISQVITMNAEEILEKKQEYVETINEMKKNRGFDSLILCVTDMLQNGSYMFYDTDSEKMAANAFNTENICQGFFLVGCLSRKKQLVPLITSAVE